MLKYQNLTHLIIGAFFDVYSELGAGFIESVYRNALVLRLQQLNLATLVEVPLDVHFRGVEVGTFRADLIVNRCVLLEIEAVSGLNHEHEKQLINYLTASRLEVGLLFNFGPRPQLRRFILSAGRVKRAAELHSIDRGQHGGP